MEITTLTDLRQNMKSYFKKIFDMNQPLFISRPNGHDMVLISKSEYLGLQETFHLLKSPKNAQRLLKTIEDDRKNKGGNKALLD